MTHYMKRYLPGARRVISSIITRNFFVTRNKQPMTIGTNRMCISRDDIAPTPCAFHDSCRQLQELSSTCVIRVVLSVSYLFSFLCFLRRIFSVCHSFRSMCQSGRMKGFERCFKVEDTWRRQNLHAAILRLRHPFITYS